MAVDKSKYLARFREEAHEHIQNLNRGLTELEKRPEDKALLETLMRTAHTLKGAATIMDFKRVTELSHKIEDGLQKAIKGETRLTKAHFDEFLECVDAMGPLLEEKAVQADDESLRIETGKLNRLMNLTGELVVSKIRLDEIVKTLAHESEEGPVSNRELGNLVQSLKGVDETLDFAVDDLQSEVLNMRLVPVEYLFHAFPRAMRDLAQQIGRNVELVLEGEKTQLDKSILDEMKDPLMHLIRNAIDHGIESPEERLRLKKSETGRVTLSARHEGTQVIIEVSDDGGGIDGEAVRKKAVSKELVSRPMAEAMSAEQLYQFLFVPGFSTREKVTETSGRGVGLDVVSEKVRKLKGVIEVRSQLGQGTRFKIRLPLTLAISESLLLGIGSEVFAIPVDHVVEAVRMSLDEIALVEGHEAVSMGGHILPLLRVREMFGIPEKGIIERKFFPVVVIQSAEKRIAILVDQIVGRRKIISKPLGAPLKNVPYISGGTILGDGRVVLILDAASMIEAAEAGTARKSSVPAASPRAKIKTSKRKISILLAEDSMNTAMLEKNVLESAGFSVVIARDGAEALKTASQEKFDLVISDVLMPKMDGFELTSRLKKDPHYREIPIIIVTTREGPEDVRRGLDAGADAYILKKDFTSEILLTTIERLVG